MKNYGKQIPALQKTPDEVKEIRKRAVAMRKETTKPGEVTSLGARLIVEEACRENPQLVEALEISKRDHIALGAYFGDAAMRGSKSDQGKRGGRPAFAHWALVRELDASLSIPAASQRARYIIRQLQEKGIKDIPEFDTIRLKLPKRGT